ncbi:hypothetical protein [Chitinophaga rhizosphaerae]|uniref:hypothetical protein n=1 Tax=Chitinophaga rhizosphaerae TaxID=1864947 RepID=UPI000F80D6D7|nr:hypothetical protein [Chitinophaga rhizosphaerae]
MKDLKQETRSLHAITPITIGLIAKYPRMEYPSAQNAAGNISTRITARLTLCRKRPVRSSYTAPPFNIHSKLTASFSSSIMALTATTGQHPHNHVRPYFFHPLKTHIPCLLP